MFAIEFKDTLEDELLSDLYVQCIKRGFILAKRPGLNVFRLDPPLIIQNEDIDLFVETFDQLLTELGWGWIVYEAFLCMISHRSPAKKAIPMPISMYRPSINIYQRNVHRVIVYIKLSKIMIYNSTIKIH